MIKRFCNYLVRFCLIIGVIFTYFITPNLAYAKDAETLGDLRREYEAKLQEKAEYDRQSEEAKQEIENKKAAIAKAEQEITQAEDDYDAAELAIVESNEKIDSLEEETKKVLLYMQQMQGQNAYVEYVSGASSMTELIMRVEAVNQVTDYIQKTTKNLEEEIKKNEDLKVELEEKKAKLASQIDSYQEEIEKQYDNIDEYSEFSNGLDYEIEMAKANYETSKSMCLAKVGRADDDVVLSTCSDMPINSGWLKPLNSGVVTSAQGYRTHPVTGQKYKFHAAIDIGGNAEGTPVYAAAAGRVSGIARKTSCGGNKVYIQVTVGGVKYTTYYYHLLSINVEVGDIVNQNTVIGTVGGGRQTASIYGGYDTCTTGAHLHFGVAEGWYSNEPPSSQVIAPPGFNNVVGYRFNSRTDFYG